MNIVLDFLYVYTHLLTLVSWNPGLQSGWVNPLGNIFQASPVQRCIHQTGQLLSDLITQWLQVHVPQWTVRTLHGWEQRHIAELLRGMLLDQTFTEASNCSWLSALPFLGCLMRKNTKWMIQLWKNVEKYKNNIKTLYQSRSVFEAFFWPSGHPLAKSLFHRQPYLLSFWEAIPVQACRCNSLQQNGWPHDDHMNWCFSFEKWTTSAT